MFFKDVEFAWKRKRGVGRQARMYRVMGTLGTGSKGICKPYYHCQNFAPFRNGNSPIGHYSVELLVPALEQNLSKFDDKFKSNQHVLFLLAKVVEYFQYAFVNPIIMITEIWPHFKMGIKNAFGLDAHIFLADTPHQLGEQSMPTIIVLTQPRFLKFQRP